VSVPALLKAAHRPVAGRQAGVDLDGSRAKSSRQAEIECEVTGVDAGGTPVVGGVGDSDGVVEVANPRPRLPPCRLGTGLETSPLRRWVSFSHAGIGLVLLVVGIWGYWRDRPSARTTEPEVALEAERWLEEQTRGDHGDHESR